MSAAELPWAPLYTVSRSGRPEVTIYGLLYAWAEDRALYANAGRALIRLGDVRTPIWSRSLLKPWQFMVIYPTLKRAYPELTESHFALMMASHQAEPHQLELLKGIMRIGQVEESALQCPACKPLQPGGETSASHLYNPCSGKHLGYLLYLKALGLPMAHYLEKNSPPYEKLQLLLGYLLNRELEEPTVDGCGMPNYALSPVELAQLYHALVIPAAKDIAQQAPDELEECLALWDELSAILRAHPEIVGGANRLDTRLMQGAGFSEKVPVIAKEGADGLLAVGIGSNSQFPDGLGILLKLSSGYYPDQLERIIMALLQHLKLASPEIPDQQSHVHTTFHFPPFPLTVAS